VLQEGRRKANPLTESFQICTCKQGPRCILTRPHLLQCQRLQARLHSYHSKTPQIASAHRTTRPFSARLPALPRRRPDDVVDAQDHLRGLDGAGDDLWGLRSRVGVIVRVCGWVRQNQMSGAIWNMERCADLELHTKATPPAPTWFLTRNDS
jgi:hypothetical protein